MMVAATRVAWLLLAAIHLLPALAVGLPRLQNRLYGMVPQSDLAILLGHRGVIFAAIVVTAALAGLWAPARPAAAGIVTISVLGFLLVYAWHGAPAGPLRGIAVVDLLAVPLLGLIWLDLWRA